MSIGPVFDAGLAALVLAVAWWATVTRVAFAAVAGFVIFGLLLAIVWVRLGAVDVALTEAAVGSGLTGALLVAAEARLRARKAPAAAEVPGLTLRIVAALLCAALSGGLALVVLADPDPAPTLAPLAAASLPATGLGNPGHRRADGLSRARHAAREGGAGAGAGRCLVAGAGRALERHAGTATSISTHKAR